MGVAMPEDAEDAIFAQFSTFVRQLPSRMKPNGEVKGRCLSPEFRRLFAEFVFDCPNLLICPAIIDLTPLSRQPDGEARNRVVARLRGWASQCKYESMRNDVEMLARQVGNLSLPQVLRLVTWAHCVNRSLRDSIIRFCAPQFDSAWDRVRFEIDAVQTRPGSREELAFQFLLPSWLTAWSMNDPLTTIDEIHTSSHPFIRNFGAGDGVDLGKILQGNVYYGSSRQSPGLQIADVGATIVSVATRGIADAASLHDYGFLMSRSIGQPLKATGLFSLNEQYPDDWRTRFCGLPEAIGAIRQHVSPLRP